jgi:hypothetical protein
MRRTLALATLIAAALAAGSAWADSVAGTWRINGTFMYGGRVVSTATPTCTFQQVGSVVSGTCRGPGAIGPITGQVVRGAVSLRWAHTAIAPNGITGYTDFNGGFVNSRLVRGTITSPDMPGSGPFTMAR